jgi:hypothetical protein
VSLQTAGQSDTMLRRLVELRWQREVIERWIHCSQIAPESQEQLQEMLSRVDHELQALEASRLRDSANEGSLY